MALHGQTPGKIRTAVRELKPFRIGNVSGQTHLSGTGRLPEEHAAMLRTQDRSGMVKYVLYSYATPMAWLLEGGEWVKPQVKYSPITSGHQSVFASAIGEMAFATA
jgi:hypothetical protein